MRIGYTFYAIMFGILRSGSVFVCIPQYRAFCVLRHAASCPGVYGESVHTQF